MRMFLLTLLTLAVAGSALAQPFENSSVVGLVQDRIVITVKEDVAMNLDKAAGAVKVGVPGLDALSSRFAVKDMEQLHKGQTGNLKNKAAASYFERVWAVDFDPRHDLQEVKKAYESLAEVEEAKVVPICKMYDSYLPNDVVSSQWYLRNMTPGGADVRAVGAWGHSLGDSNVIVAVLDSGVDWHHPDLGGTHPDKVNGAVWTNWTEYYGSPGVDDDHNGKVDDIRGWDFVNVPFDGYPDEDVANPDNDPMDYESHGTNCAGIIAAITNNGTGIAGTAPGCKIMAVRVGWLPDGDTTGVVRMDFAASGMLYAVNNGARIINCSWGSAEYLANYVTLVQNEGGLIVTAAGNDNSSDAPYLGTRSGVMAVAASDDSDLRASFSNFGTWIEITAPGVGMYTTNYNHVSGTSGYASVSGTSFASPQTAGAAALVWSANPTWTYTQVANQLMNTADDLDAKNPAYAGLLGAGRVNLTKALDDGNHQYPDEFPTLYDALNSASPGDVVQVRADAAVTGPMEVIGGKDLTILGGYDATYTTRDPVNNKTVVTGTAVAPCMRTTAGDMTPATVIDGFHFTGGGGTQFSSIPYSGRFGGGVILSHASPTLRNIEVSGCSVGALSTLGCGGGIMLYDSDAVLENVHIHGNTAVYGAGLYAYQSNATMTDCVIEDNTPLNDNLTYTSRGGGVYGVDSDLTMVNCTVSGHVNVDAGGGMYMTQNTGSTSLQMDGGAIQGNTSKNGGAGLFMNAGSADLNRLHILDNVPTPTAGFMFGGGFNFSNTSVAMDSVVCQGNQAIAGAGGNFDACTSVTLTSNLFSGNTATYSGGAMYIAGSTVSLTGNTLAQNFGAGGGAGINSTASNLSLSGNIIAFNTGGTGLANGLAVSAEPTLFTCNDVYGNDGTDLGGMVDPTGTNGNISVDPEFCGTGDDPFNLKTTSPCLPANSGGCDLIGALTSGCGVSPVPDPGNQEVPATFVVDKPFPNPFNPRVTIRFALPEAAPTSVVIYDLAGRKVRTVVDDVLPAQVHEVSWSGNDETGRKVAAGVYFYMVTSGEHRSVGRMALVK